MAERKSEKEEARIHAILEAINQGMDVSGVLSHADKAMQDQVGINTENRVLRMLTKLRYIDALALTGKWSRDDHKGRDIALRLTNPYSGNDQIVFVQVKSSPEFVAEFRHKVKQKFALQDHEVDQFLRQEKLIVVNGREPEHEVITSFENQLDAILQHHAQEDHLRRNFE